MTFCSMFHQVIKDSMRNKADLTDMSRMWVSLTPWSLPQEVAFL